MIARENAFILPEGLLNSFEYDHLGKIKDQVDFAFQSNEANEWLQNIETEALFVKHNLYIVNFMIYRTDGNSVTVLDTFEDVPVLRFKQIMKLFAQCAQEVKDYLNRGVSLGSIYHMVPVRETDKGQIDIGRVLSLYKALLSGHQIDRATIFAYASEALDKGMRQLSKSKMDNYKNLDLFPYKNKEDFYIKKICMNYLVLMKVLQELDLLIQPIFTKKTKEEKTMTATVDLSPTIKEMEAFLANQGFSNEAKALFYLGSLVHRVALAQYLKEHKTKPILKKIQFQGMNQRDCIRLYEEVVEKLIQYSKMTLFAEHLINRFHDHYGAIVENWPLNDHENIFYIMAGYGYMVGNKAGLSKEEVEVVKEEMQEEMNENDE